MTIFLVYTTDEWQSLDSYQLEGVASSLEEAHKTKNKCFQEYRESIKVVIKTTELDSNSFSDIEVYDTSGELEWKRS